MKYRRFGKTEISIPLLTCGGMRFQHSWEDMPFEKIPAQSQENLERTVERAFELGINHFETARGYGTSERQLGRALKRFKRDEITVQTKVGPNEDPSRFVENFTDSLVRLQLEYVDLFAIHGINDRERLGWSLKPKGCLEEAHKLKEKGYIRHIGFSTHGPTDVILEAVRSGGFDYVNLHWYYIFQKNLPAIEEATRRDMGVFIISPSDKGGMLYNPSRKLLDLCRPLHPMVFNDLFCLSRPEIHTISIGAARPGDFDLHLEALELLDRADEILPPIRDRLRSALEEAVGADFAYRFEEGLPTWEKTPGRINIPVILWLLKLAKAYDMIEYGKMRYGLLGKGESWFPGENAAEVDRIDLSQALSASPFADRIPRLLKEAHELLYEEKNGEGDET